MLFAILSVLLSFVTVFSLNWMLRWSYRHDDGFISYLLAGIFSLFFGVLGNIGAQPLDWKTKLFLLRWMVMLIVVIYLMFWSVNECMIGPLMSA